MAERSAENPQFKQRIVTLSPGEEVKFTLPGEEIIRENFMFTGGK